MRSHCATLATRSVIYQLRKTHRRFVVARIGAAAGRAVDEVLRVRGVGLALLDGRGGSEGGGEDGKDDGGEAHDY